MTPPLPPAPAPTPSPPPPGWLVGAAALPGLVLSVGGMVVCYWVLGATLGLFLAGLGLCAILVPTLVVAEEGFARPLVAAAAVVAGIAGVWLYVALLPHPADEPYPAPDQWAACVAVVASFGLPLAALPILLRRLRTPPSLASFVALAAGLAWLSWPIWLSPRLAGRDRLVAALVAAHPLFAVNGALRDLGLWDQQRLAYNLTVLNRDVPYHLPATVWGAVLLHAVEP